MWKGKTNTTLKTQNKTILVLVVKSTSYFCCMKTKLLPLLLCISSFAAAQNINTVKLDSFFNALEKDNKGMGSVAISKNNKLLYSKSVGYSYINNEIKKPANNTTKYRIGSISKTFTAVIIFQLIEENKLQLTDKLSKWFPNILDADKTTIENLLNHSSGLYNVTNDPTYLLWNTNPISQKQMLDYIVKTKQQFTPGTKHEYSNTNYILLTYIIEKITGKSYAENVKQRITDKMKLKNTYYGSKTDTAKNEAFSYTFKNNNWTQETETDMSIPLGAGAILSTAEDLVKFAEAFFTYKLLTKESIDKMKQMNEGFGYGLFEIPFYNRKALGHNGGIDGFVSNMGYFTTDSIAFAYTSNGVNYKFNDVLIAILSNIFNRDFTVPDFTALPYEHNAAELNAITGMYSSTAFPLKIEITTDGKKLFAQATGQSAFELSSVSKNKFEFTDARITVTFYPDKNQMEFKQGVTIMMTKE